MQTLFSVDDVRIADDRHPESVTVVPFRVRQIRGESLGYYRHVILEFTIHRVYCHECHHRELEHIHFLSHPKSRLTKSLERTILELRQHMSIKALADFYDLRWHTIKELEMKTMAKTVEERGILRHFYKNNLKTSKITCF